MDVSYITRKPAFTPSRDVTYLLIKFQGLDGQLYLCNFMCYLDIYGNY